MSRFSILSTCCLVSLFANPENGIVIEGSASFERLSSELVIHADDRSVIHWDSFSIDPHETTRFIQGGSEAAVLNRVTGDQMSQLLGTLASDGKVFLVNPNGIIVGKEGVIDAASFIASSLDIPDSAFLSGEEFVFDGTSLKPIVNEGTIRAKNGDILLLASRIENKGTLSAPKGDISIGAGQRILVSVQGKRSLYVDIPGDGILNEGQIEALRTVFASNANPYSLGIQNKGRIDALQIENQGGEIYLRCKGASFDNGGTLSAVNGSIQIEAENAHFVNDRLIQANGGSISITSLGDETSLVDQKRIANNGTMEAGMIYISAPKFSNTGPVAAEEKIAIFIPGTYVESIHSRLSAREIKILAGNYFTSGKILAKGESGGRIEINTERFISTAGLFDASGTEQGGSIKLSSASLKDSLYLNKYVVLDVNGKKQGGTVELISPLPVNSTASVKLDGRVSGTLSVPSSLASTEFIGYIDPTPESVPLLWAAISNLKNENLAASYLQPWNHDFAIDLNQMGIFQQAACPPAPTELLDPHPTAAPFSGFGDLMLALPSGNIVVTKGLDSFVASNAGAVFLYNATTGALISTLTGGQANDLVGFGNSSVAALTNGNYVVRSTSWANGAALTAGAATWVDGVVGMNGVVSATNSIVGTQQGDNVSSIFASLTNGHFVVGSPNWQSNAVANAGLGASTWGNGTTGQDANGSFGAVSVLNSLVGTQVGDRVANSFILTLTNGNYVVPSANWKNLETGAANAGAATWGNGTTGKDANGFFGPVSTTNSIVGTQPNDGVSSPNSKALANGHYVVRSSGWDDVATGVANVGAATWGNGTNGTDGNGAFGPVSTANSLVGTMSGDSVSISDVLVLTNGNYVVCSANWRNDVTGLANAGATTWGNGTNGRDGNGVFGPVSSSNSLVGTSLNDRVGGDNVIQLTNGHYVVGSSTWDDLVSDAGIVAWANGTTGKDSNGAFGSLTSANGILGSTLNDRIGGKGVIALTNGNYVVNSDTWDSVAPAVTNVGAATWGNGLGGTVGFLTSANSLVGTTSGDNVGRVSVALTNGNYVVGSSNWDNGSITNAGFAQWGNGLGGTVGPVSAANCLVGLTSNDAISSNGISALTNGNYVVLSPAWHNPVTSVANAGALTWGDGLIGTVGAVSTANSLVGTQSGDAVGSGGAAGFRNLSTASFAVLSPNWADGTNAFAGAVTPISSIDGTFCDGTYGAISTSNSFPGANVGAQLTANFRIPVVANNSSGTNLIAFQFQNYDELVVPPPGTPGFQTRVFLIEGLPFPIPPTPVPIPAPLAAGIHDFAIAVSEPFYEWNFDWLSLKDILAASDIYPPLGTYKGLQQELPSLAFKVAENESPRPSAP